MPARTATLLSLIFVFLLAGCEVQPPRPSLEEVEAQTRAYAQGQAEGQRRAELEYFSQQAAVYSACTFLIDLCPASLTAKGREVIEQNNHGGGGESPLYWALLMLKFATLAGGLTLLWILSALGLNRLVRPSHKAVAYARAQVKTAESEAQKIISEAKLEAQNVLAGIATTKEEMRGEIEALETQRGQLQAQIDALTAKVTQAKEELERLNQDLQRINLAKKAASNFK